MFGDLITDYNPTCITVCIENALYSSYVLYCVILANENAIRHFLLPSSTKNCNRAMIG